MLFFLRNIRRKMLQENKITTYLLYAIGEIFLVVVGILIAVNIDDWNEANKLKSKEAIYYQKLLEDIQQDATEVERLLTESESRLQHANQLLHLLQQEEIQPDRVSNEMFGAISLITFTFKPSTAAFDGLKASGGIELIDKEVIKNLRIYYTKIDGIVDVVNINSDQAVKLLNATDNYVSIGWHLIDIANEAIDESLIDMSKLKQLIKTDQSYREELTSDAIYFISANARVRMLYQGLLKDIKKMETILQASIKKQQL